MDAGEAQRTVKSIATMLGWDNVPTRRALEMSLSALKARVRTVEAELNDADAEIARLRDELQRYTQPEHEPRPTVGP